METVGDDVIRASVELYLQHGSQEKAARAAGVAQSTISKHLQIAKERGFYRERDGQVEALQAVKVDLPKGRRKRVFYLTCAQDHTKLHAEWWRNLLALVEHDGATLMVSTFKYDKDAQGQREKAKWETREQEIAASYPAEIVPYVCDDRVDIAPNLTFCGELNILPTAERPLSGLESYTYRKSTIVPHPKIEMRSIPTMKGEGVKLMYTTGCVTQRNYIKRKVGYKAEHFHTYGALIVEVDSEGRWYCRQVAQGPDGAAHDMDRRALKGKVTTGHRVADVTWGDVHATKIDLEVAQVSFGHSKDSMIEVLRPHTQHVHDILDFSARSHHTRRDPHEVYRAHRRGQWELSTELRATADILYDQIHRPWCETFVVDSNHDRWLERWLKEVDWRADPANAKMILRMNLNILESIDSGWSYHLVREAINLARPSSLPLPGGVRFLLEDESHVILPNIEGGIECGLHGDRGANGAKGTVEGFAKIDRKVNVADKHSAAIVNHAYVAGTSGLLDMGYNKGLSSWTHAHIVTYPNGTRAIYSVWKGKWRA